MDELRNDPEYEIRWPSETLADELDRLIERGRAGDVSNDWRDEVETLLGQAFASRVPQADFEKRWNQSSGRRLDPIYGDEEPF